MAVLMLPVLKWQKNPSWVTCGPKSTVGVATVPYATAAAQYALPSGAGDVDDFPIFESAADGVVGGDNFIAANASPSRVSLRPLRTGHTLRPLRSRRALDSLRAATTARAQESVLDFSRPMDRGGDIGVYMQRIFASAGQYGNAHASLTPAR